MEEKFYKEVSDMIRKARKHKEYTQLYMAVKLGITQTGYSKIESGKSKCSGPRLLEIFKLLGSDPPKGMDFKGK